MNPGKKSNRNHQKNIRKRHRFEIIFFFENSDFGMEGKRLNFTIPAEIFVFLGRTPPGTSSKLHFYMDCKSQRSILTV